MEGRSLWLPQSAAVIERLTLHVNKKNAMREGNLAAIAELWTTNWGGVLCTHITSNLLPTMAKPKKLSQKQLLDAIKRATRDGEAIYEFLPGARKLDFYKLYCDRLIKPAGTRRMGWQATEKALKGR